MDASGWAAWYAALVSTALGYWQVHTYRREKRISLKVEIDVGIYSTAPTGMDEAVRYRIVNKSGVPVTVPEVGLMTPNYIEQAVPLTPPSRQQLPPAPPKEQLPRVVPPGESAHVFVQRHSTVAGNSFDLLRWQEPMQFYAMTNDGRRFTSLPIKRTQERLEVERRWRFFPRPTRPLRNLND